jgi:DNA-binding transcriptional MerR regulator
MPIGEFAEASRLSQKALRLYGENGVLTPAWVDRDNGYRFYRAEQLRVATLIALLGRAGLPLAEIRSFLREPSVERLAVYERELTDELADRRRVLRYVKRILEEETMYDVLTRQVAEQPYVSRTKHVPARTTRSTAGSRSTAARRPARRGRSISRGRAASSRCGSPCRLPSYFACCTPRTRNATTMSLMPRSRVNAATQAISNTALRPQ